VAEKPVKVELSIPAAADGEEVVTRDRVPACRIRKIANNETNATRPPSIHALPWLVFCDANLVGADSGPGSALTGTTMDLEQTGQLTDWPAAVASTTSSFPQCGQVKLMSFMAAGISDYGL
jgi:hypothetical protein